MLAIRGVDAPVWLLSLPSVPFLVWVGGQSLYKMGLGYELPGGVPTEVDSVTALMLLELSASLVVEWEARVASVTVGSRDWVARKEYLADMVLVHEALKESFT